MRANKQKTEVAFDATILGMDVTIHFVRATEWHRELYGADADGRRGVMMAMIDEDAASDVRVEADWMTDVSEAIPITALPGPQQAAVQQAVEKYLNETEPEPQDNGPEDQEED